MIKRTLIQAVLLVTATSLFAQPQQINIQQAIELALQNNFNIKQAENLLDREETGVTTAWLAFAPFVTSSLNANRQTGLQFNSLTGQLTESTVQSVSGSLSANFTLFSGMRNINNLRASQSNLIAQSERVKRSRELVIFNTAAAYLQVLLDSKLLEIAKQNLGAQNSQLGQIEAQVQVGARPQIDQFNQESIVATTELQMIQRENSLNLNKIRLLRILQIDPLKEYEFEVPTFEDSKVIVDAPPALAELLDKAYAQRTDLKSLEASLRASRYGLKASYGALAPTITFGGSIGSNYNDQRRKPPTFAEKISFGDQFFTENVNKGLSFNINLPIFQRWGRMNTINQTQIGLKNSELDYLNLRLQVMQEVQQAYNDYINFAKQVESTRKAFQAAERALLTEQERYKVGASTLIELTRANASFVEASANKTNATYNYVFQDLLLDYYIGMITSNISFDKYK